MRKLIQKKGSIVIHYTSLEVLSSFNILQPLSGTTISLSDKVCLRDANHKNWTNRRLPF
jgi:hypothetical protein